MTETKTATLIRRRPDFNGDAAVYRLSEAMTVSRWDDDGDTTVEVSTVLVSAIGGPRDEAVSAPETYIFHADESGEVLNWCELPGSMRGTLSHADALARAGYSICG